MSEPRPVSVTGLSILTALGRGPEAQLAGTAAFSEVRRFDTSDRRVHHAATAAEAGTLEEELDLAIATACGQAGVDRSTTPLLLALHAAADVVTSGSSAVYTSACVSAQYGGSRRRSVDPHRAGGPGRRCSGAIWSSRTSSRCSTPVGRWPTTTPSGRSVSTAGGSAR